MMMGFGLLFVLLFVLFVIGAIGYIGGGRPLLGEWLQSRSPAGRGSSNNVAEILGERYARGEISRDEYQRMQQDLRD